MNIEEIISEIEMRINPEDLTLTSNDFHDIMNMFDLDEQKVVFLYNKVVKEKREEISKDAKEVMNYFRVKGYHYPSFRDFKTEFEKNGDYLDTNLLRSMYKQEIEDENQMSMFEINKIIKEEFKAIREEGNFKKDAAEITKNWGGSIKKSKDAELSPEDFEDILDAGDVAREEIKGEFGDDEFTPMTDDEYKSFMKESGEDEDSSISQQGLFKAKDAEGSEIKKHALVKLSDGSSEKKGRVLGFGDDGKCNQTVMVDFQWPVDMKHMDPEAMGKKTKYPQDLVVQGMNENNGEDGRGNLRRVEVTYVDGSVVPTSMAAHLTDEDINNYFSPGKLFNIGSGGDNMQAVKSVNIIKEINEDNMENINETKMPETLERLENIKSAIGAEELADLIIFKMDDGLANSIIDAIEQDYDISSYSEELEEVRSLGHGVKNSGDRNVKKSDDHSHAPVTTLPEGRTLNSKIKTLSEGAVKKKDILNFIKEEANNFAKDIKGDK